MQTENSPSFAKRYLYEVAFPAFHGILYCLQVFVLRKMLSLPLTKKGLPNCSEVHTPNFQVQNYANFLYSQRPICTSEINFIVS